MKITIEVTDRAALAKRKIKPRVIMIDDMLLQLSKDPAILVGTEVVKHMEDILELSK